MARFFLWPAQNSDRYEQVQTQLVKVKRRVRVIGPPPRVV